ncbi:hypothetical protein B0H94_108155 [Salsuginibacillus halophilus]|uniref:Uncharacterized protein n=1 Tax=Salsuginibacillus halophilus TaxID=517424 RepID=A0A2P8HEA0_9BACI|nr:hypothetical protein [Salsuginibacillus halophilus]PSL44542.1 hypothetical protein B0H94_108155 [Salsuginibacillus halophilus]
MQNIQMEFFLEMTVPDWLSILKKNERTIELVLPHDWAQLSKKDVEEIVQNVIMEKSEKLVH